PCCALPIYVVPADTDRVLVPAALRRRRGDLRGRQGLTPGPRSLPNRSGVVGGATHIPGNVCSGLQVPHKTTGGSRRSDPPWPCRLTSSCPFPRRWFRWTAR